MIRLLVPIFVASLLPLDGASAKDYQIKFSRPDKAGKKYRIKTEITKKQSVTVSKDGNVIQKKVENVKATLQAVVLIDKVDKDGAPLKLTITIEKFGDDKGDTLLKTGTVVTAQSLEGKTIYRIGEEALDKKPRDILSDIIKTKTRNSLKDDDVFGSKQRRKVGESWSMNTAAAIKDFKAMKMEIEGVSGTVKLEGVETHGGHKCLRVSMKIDIKKVKTLPDTEAFEKQGLKLESGSLKMTTGGLLPVDVKLDSPKRTMSMTMNMKIVGVKGPVKGIEMAITTRMA
ncbi:MAG: hypothetical protein ACE5KM_10075, partial [Planctomycetaceae bacterium]